MDLSAVVENFCGVYLLKSLNPKYKGRTYIGYTVDPNRRIKQHNRGKRFGGAWRTSKRGPWEMVLTLYGFPSVVAALKFEWAWQHPKKSRRLKHIVKYKKSSETSVQYKIGILFTMLSTPPWNRLPLTLRWLSADVIDAPPNLTPPAHVPVKFGTVIAKKVKTLNKSKNSESIKKREIEKNSWSSCQICRADVDEKDLLKCVNHNCEGSWHIFCIADKFLKEEARLASFAKGKAAQKRRKRIIPVEGSCPKCKAFILWGDLIRKKQGCFGGVNSSSPGSPVD